MCLKFTYSNIKIKVQKLKYSEEKAFKEYINGWNIQDKLANISFEKFNEFYTVNY